MPKPVFSIFKYTFSYFGLCVAYFDTWVPRHETQTHKDKVLGCRCSDGSSNQTNWINRDKLILPDLKKLCIFSTSHSTIHVLALNYREYSS